jgi:hypothetical protein
MSSNHLKYDTCAYATSIKESTEPLEYWLFKGKYETCNASPNADFNNIIDFPSRADVESELFGINRLGTDCPSLKFDPTKPFKNPMFSPPIIGQNIYGITPSNLINTKSNMINENNLGINLCSLPSNKYVLEKFTNNVPLFILLNGYDNIGDYSIIINLKDKVEPGIDHELLLNSISKNITMGNPSDYYRSDITPTQINKLNYKISNYESCANNKKYCSNNKY